MTEAYPLSWPQSLPRITTSPAKSQFKTSLTTRRQRPRVAQAVLGRQREEGRKRPRVQQRVPDERNPKDAGVAVYFTWDGISICIAVDRYQRIEENLQAIHHVIEAERTKLRHGGLNLVRAAFRGYAALPPPSAAKDDPWTVLGVKRGASAVEIESVYREKAKNVDPNTGGSNEQMAALNAARVELLGRSA